MRLIIPFGYESTTLALQGKHNKSPNRQVHVDGNLMPVALIFVNAKIYLAKSHIIHTLSVVASG